MTTQKEDKKTQSFNFNAMPSSESPYVPAQFSTQNIKQEEIVSATDTQKTEPETMVNVTPASVTIESKKGKSGFKMFVVIGVLVTAAIYGAVAYIYFQNQSLKRVVDNLTKRPEVTQAPKPEFNSSFVKIENGSVIYSDGTTKNTLINKSSFPDTGIAGFAKVAVAPSNNLLCFESLPPALKPAVYVSDTSGTNTKKISPNKTNCLWKSDSNYIFYQGKDSIRGNLNIYMYNLKTFEEIELTEEALPDDPPDFNIVGLSSDETKMICSFVDPESDDTFQCEIDLKSLAFSTL